MKQASPFAILTGAEKQIKWLEYQSLRLPYIPVETEAKMHIQPQPDPDIPSKSDQEREASFPERPVPPPEIPRTMPDQQRIRHGQYDAVIARMKQAELQSRKTPSFSQVTQ